MGVGGIKIRSKIILTHVHNGSTLTPHPPSEGDCVCKSFLNKAYNFNSTSIGVINIE